MKRVALGALASLILLRCFAGSPTPPRLMVVLVVDQMRGDYLDRFGGDFEGGFARILEDGAIFTDAVHDHAATLTAVGHSTVPTGVVPSRHGIIANEFYDRVEERVVYPHGDPDASIIGEPFADGRSPHRLRRTGLADWLKEADPSSHAYSLALKDMAAVLMGGKSADAAFWYDEEAERVLTSDYYLSELPDWVERQGSGRTIASLLEAGWDRHLSAAIDEGDLDDHHYAAGEPFPFVDDVTLHLARETVEQERLGADEIPDLLFVSISGTDFVGHRFGPDSEEVRTYYRELDLALETLFDDLDRIVGEDRWSLVLTADHGVGATPEESKRRGKDARRVSREEYDRDIRAAMRAAVTETGMTENVSVLWLGGPHLRSESASSRDLRRVRRAMAEQLEELDWVEWAFPADEVAGADRRGSNPVDWFGRSYHVERSPDVSYAIKENYLVGETTASHGTPHYYDQHVPIVFMGPGIEPGRHDARVRTVDIAPTVARILGIDAPNDLDGRVLKRVIR